jgi:uncharacterized protein (DUF697 family)
MTGVLKQIGKSMTTLNPQEVRNLAEQPFRIGLMATSDIALRAMWQFFAPAGIDEAHRREISNVVQDMGPQGSGRGQFTFELWEEGLPRPASAFTFHSSDPSRTIAEILEKHDDLKIALARRLPAFRRTVSDSIISEVAKENAIFAATTALPNIIPNVIELPLAIGEFASDTAVLTVNQLRMAFLLAASNGHEIGYREQKLQVASLIAGAFGWRALARELVGKIPFGGGIIGKAAVAYAGTWVVGRSLERFYRGSRLSSKERKQVYDEGLARGREEGKRVLAMVKR